MRHNAGLAQTSGGIRHGPPLRGLSQHGGEQRILEEWADHPGTGVGIGLFTSPGHLQTATYGNVIVNNRVTGNGHPGVALHSHRLTHNLTDNAIIGNYIAGNGAGTTGPSPTATPGPTGINLSGVSPLTGTIVSGNVIKQEHIDIAVHTPAQIDIHMNDLSGGAVGVAILSEPGAGTANANATQNWWGCSGGPQAPACSSVQGAVTFAPWLTSPSTGSDNGQQSNDGQQ